MLDIEQDLKEYAREIGPECRDESPLLRLATRPEANGKPYLDHEQFAAGELLRRDFEWSQLAPRVTSEYERGVGSGSWHFRISDNALTRVSDRAIAARQRLFSAFDAVGPELSGIIYHVCCLAGGIEAAERHLTLPRRSGKAVLALSLTRLARHYGLKRRLRQAATDGIAHWAADGSRPHITPVQPQHQP
jgi:Domain of unknown function (DUF6456)